MDFCKTCGALLRPQDPCCPHCGAARPAPPAPPAAPAAAPPSDSAAQPPRQTLYRRVNAPAPEPPLTTLQYLGCLLLFCIPFVGLILMLIWAFGNPESAALKRLARAALINWCIFTLLAVILVVYVALSATLAAPSYHTYSYSMPYSGAPPSGDVWYF